MEDAQRREIQTALEQPLAWCTIAAAAWQGFQKNGTGCLLIHEFPPKAVEYVSRSEGLSFLRTNGIDPWVKKYDPAKEVIVYVLHSGVIKYTAIVFLNNPIQYKLANPNPCVFIKQKRFSPLVRKLLKPKEDRTAFNMLLRQQIGGSRKK